MSRFSAETLDLSRLGDPLAIIPDDHQDIVDQRIAAMTAELLERGIEYTAGEIEADTIPTLQESGATRELRVIAMINAAFKGGQIAFAVGTDLDHLGAFFGVTRRVISTDGNGNDVLESDTEFRRRVQLAPEAFSTTGTLGGYKFHALTSHVDVLNADVWSDAPGSVQVAIQSRQGNGLASGDLLDTVRAHLMRDDIKPLTDMITVRSVRNHHFSISLRGFVLRGPDPTVIRDSVEASVGLMTRTRRTPTRDMPLSAIYAAAHVPSVDKVIIDQPTADIAMGRGEVAVLDDLTVTMETYAG